MKQRRQFGRKSALKPAAKPTFRLEALERRLLFSADLPFVVDGLIAVDPNNSHIVSVAGSLQAAVNDDAVVQPVQLVIIDAATPDYESIIADLEAQTGATFEIYVLDAEQDGIAQISALLAEHANVSALHLISHGSDGQIALGDSSLSLVDLLARADEVALWQDSFTIDGDFLIYGCDLASTDAGKNFVTTLSQLTGADVAASIDLTGAAEQGGDWQLEYTTGAVETRVAVSDALQSDYQHSLATYTVTTLADTGAGSLRQAILDANASAGADRIEFAVAGTISLTSGLPSIDQQLDLDASAMAGAGGVPGVILDGAAAGDTDGLLFDSGSDGSSVKGLAIVNFDRNGIYLLGSNNHSISANYIGTDGAIAQANGGAGIWLWNSASNTLGGTLPVRGNVISGNGLDGISLVGPATTNNNIVGNYIGTAANGTDKVANLGAGISISAQASFNVVGGALANQGNLISGNGGDGIVVQGLGTNNNDIYRNYIGTTIASDAALGNSRYGVFIYDGAQNTRVGGDAAGEGNVISGNASSGLVIHGNGGLTTINNVVTGNSIGTDSSKLVAVGNDGEGVLLLNGATDNVIGSAIKGNIIAGNTGNGVAIEDVLSSGNQVIGNYIGVDATGATALGNIRHGVVIYNGAHDNLVGGEGAGEGNVLSGNGKTGLAIQGSMAASANSNIAAGNYIGTDHTGANAIANGEGGVQVNGGASNNIIGSGVSGNTISGNTGVGVTIDGALSAGNHVLGNYIGVNAVGGAALANTGEGIVISGQASSNTIGGATAAQLNVISGNGSDGVLLTGSSTANNAIVGNYIGTDAAGTAAIANAGNGIFIVNQAHSNTIGGGAAGQGNLISGNASSGIVIQGFGSDNNVVHGNYIGTTVTGDGALGNSRFGVIIYADAQNNRVGGDGAGEGNVLSGNIKSGVSINGAGDTLTINNVVTGNFIGTDSTGVIAVANGEGGVRLYGGANNNTIGSSASRGNVISGNNGDGVTINGSLSIDNHIIGNYIGVDVSGNLALGNTGDGVGLEGGTSGNFVGGDTVGERNIVSANGYDGVSISGAGTNNNDIQGNYIGLDIGGDDALGNGRHGVVLSGGASNNIVGGANPEERNVISGNVNGVYIWGAGTTSNQVAGNYIGTDRLGASVVANASNGVRLSNGAAGNTIGGEGASERNVISGNVTNGVEISHAGTDGNVVSSNYIGVAADGIAVMGNQQSGVLITNGAQNTVVGSSNPGDGNLISGNKHGVYLFGATTASNTVLGNLIGTDSTGSQLAGNIHDGVRIAAGAHHNTVGGTTVSERNVISANGSDGIELTGANTHSNTITGNFVGTTSDGSAALGNVRHGILLYSGVQNTSIGGDNAGEGNTVSGNGINGITVNGNGGATTINNVISGNFIGTNASGSGVIGNLSDGIQMGNGANANTVGGTSTGAGNVISSNGNDGIEFYGLGTNDNVIAGNYIGTTSDGSLAAGNGRYGVVLYNGVQNTQIGGAGSGEGNVISGNGSTGVVVDGAAGSTTTNNTISGNFIGTNASGSGVIGNLNDGIQMGNGANANTVGGTSTGAGNVISSNGNDGIELYGLGTNDNVIAGNYIGTTSDGSLVAGNGRYGVVLYNGVQNTQIGGAGSGEGNVISGNGSTGVVVNGAAGSTTTNNTISGNFIGTNKAGTSTIANSGDGVALINGANNNTIGGDSTSGEGNLVSGNNSNGIRLSGSGTDSNRVVGNFIGTTFDGSTALANGLNGVGIFNGVQGTVLGGGNPGERNIISGNGENGVAITGNGGSTTVNNTISGNYIGTNAAGTAAVANAQEGIYLDTGASNTLIGGDRATGHGNLISGNAGDGIYIQTGADANYIYGNNIGLTANGGAALGNGGSGVVLDTATNLIGAPAVGAENIISANGENGILLLAGGSGTVIVGNTIGLDITGTIAFGNGHNGIYIESDSNRIGGVTAVERNLISGNGLNGIELQGAGSNVVIGNYIGTDITGTLPLANHEDGIHITSGSAGNTIGGATTAERNVISGNGEEGIEIRGVGSDANVIQGNFIGTTINGDSALGNGTHGIVVVDSVQLTQIGGDAGKGNIISGNTQDGVVISGAEGGNTLGNVVSGNYIGTDSTGLFVVGNGRGISVSASGNTIGGDADSGEGNVISGNNDVGVFLGVGANTTIVTGNIIGLAMNGVLAMGNPAGGVVVHSSGNRIGGLPSGERNIISANGGDGGNGIHFIVGGHGNVLMGNIIGLDVSGTLDRGNSGNGVLISSGGFVSGTTNMVTFNQIAFNSLAGVAVPDAAMRDQTILSNSIHSNGGLAIDLGVAGVDANVPSTVDTTVNDLLNYPVISHVATDETASVTIEGTFVGAPGAAYRIEIYSNPAQDATGYGEATTLIGVLDLTTDATGNASFNETLSAVLPIGTVVSATATVDFENGDFGGTSEMAQNVLAERYNEAPVFTSPAAFSIDENATLVGTVVSSDSDGDVPQYALVGSSDDSLFSIDAATGELRFQTAADFEVPTDTGINNTYDVTVQVDDGFGGVVTQAISVSVSDVNDNAPVITPSQVYSIDENALVADVVNTVLVSDADTVGTLQNWTISGGNADGTFQINTATGEISIADVSKLDYETNSQYTLSITVSDGVATSNAETVVVNINDINETPVFTSPAAFSVDENTALVGSVVATDVDADTLQYALLGSTDDNLFSIDTNTGELSFQAAPDFEAAADSGGDNIYNVTVQVDDGFGGVVTQLVTVTVNNIDEYSVTSITDTDAGVNTVDENVASSASIGLTAYSEDLDAGDDISYSLADNAGGRFSIDSVSGVVSVSGALDYEVSSSHVIVVQATSSDSSSVTRSFTIAVADVNDNAPVITPSQVYSIDENALVADVVNTVLVSDADTVGTLQNWTISGGNADGTFQINTATGEISIADVSKLDYETTNQYTLSITVGDGVATSNIETVVVNINDINEAPVFTSPAAFSIDENATLVGTVVTTDVDGGAPQYALVGSTDDSLFSIDAVTGELRFQVAADFEAPADASVNNTYDVTVQVDDGLGGVVTQLVTVTVNNLNEFGASAIVDTDTNANAVDENVASGTGIGLTVFSEDLDAGDNVNYSLTDNAGGRFSIDAVSGVVSVSAALDFEANSSHVIVVQATSSDSSSITRSFSISVTDVNDNLPIIAPGQVFSIDENASAGDAVETVLVADADTVGTLQNWAINGGNTDGIFQINATTGEISIADVSKLDYETSSQYTLSIAVADGLNASNTETLVVNINDVNEAPTATADTLQAVEDTYLVINPLSDLLANDLDPDGDVLSVSAVTPPAHGILIDNLDGSWTYTPDSNYAGADRIQYQVSDNRGETRWVNVDIDVASVNDLPTISVAAAINVDENSNGIITQVQATDVDATKLTVSITGGADSEAFRVDSVTGYVSFISSPDYEVAVDADGDNRYELELTVSDNAGGSVSRQVEVYVNNVNEAPTVVATEFASAEGFTGSLGQVQMVDPDSGDVVVLTITGGSGQGVFEIDAQSGEIVQHDGAVAGVYTLEVQLTDNSGTVANAVLTIRIGPSLPATGEANGIHISDQLYSTSPTSESEGLSVVIQIVPDGDSIVVETAIAIDGSDSDESSAVEDSEDTADSEVVDGTSRTDNAQSPFDSLQSTDSRFDLRSLQNDTSYSQLSSSGQSKIAEQGGYELVLELLLEEAEELVESVNRIVDDAFGVSALSATLSPSMLAALDGMHSVTDQQEQQAAERMELIVTAGAAVSVSLTVGFVTWLLNSGSLLATALSTSPLWRPLDPVPILGQPPVPGEDDSRGAENA